MKKFSRIALALSLVMAMGTPALSNTFFDFSFNFNGNTLSGTTAPGQNEFGAGYAVTSFSTLTFNGVDITGNLYSGNVNTTSGVSLRNAGNVQMTFTENGFSLNEFLYFTPDSAWNSTESGAQVWRSITSGTTPQLRGGNTSVENPSGSGTYIISTPGFSTFGNLQSGDVARVPEINGSGFAYIAFILGALGLWLYSGAGRGRVEEEPIAI